MFSFKQFSIRQDRTAMKVGTDGVLLGAWTTPPTESRRVLDIGTGSGVIALMMAQRFEKCKIDAVEIEYESFRQAMENISESPWRDRVNIYHSSIQEFTNRSNCRDYDCIVSNPPYFTNSLKSPDSKRTTARHNTSLPLNELLEHSAKLLKIDGVLSVILPIQEGEELLSLAKQFNFQPHHICQVYPTVLSQSPKRLLIELVFAALNPSLQRSILTIEQEKRGKYTEDYISLTKEFYLKF